MMFISNEDGASKESYVDYFGLKGSNSNNYTIWRELWNWKPSELPEQLLKSNISSCSSTVALNLFTQ